VNDATRSYLAASGLRALEDFGAQTCSIEPSGAEGASASTAGFSALATPGLPWVDVALPRAEAEGWRIQATPQVRGAICIARADGAKLRVLGAPKLDDVCGHLALDEVGFVAAPQRSLLLAASDGPALEVCMPAPGELSVRPLEVAYDDPPEPTRAKLDVSGWCEPDTPGSWLHGLILSRAKGESVDDSAVAAGLVARLWPPVPHGDRDAWHGTQRRAFRVFQWAARLDRSQRRGLVELAQAEVTSLDRALHTLERGCPPDLATWRFELRDLLLRRDDLEAAYFVLRTLGLARELGAALWALDERVLSHLAALPVAPIVRDARLSLVRALSVDAWWASSALPEKGDPMTINDELDAKRVRTTARPRVQAALRAAPWCWPRVEPLCARAESVAEGATPHMAIGQVPLVTVRRPHQVSLWTFGSEPAGLPSVELSARCQAQLDRAQHAMSRCLPLLWQAPVEPPAPFAYRVDSCAVDGAATLFMEPFVDGPSLALAFFLSLASRSVGQPLPGSFVASAAMDEAGQLSDVGDLERKLRGVARMAPRLDRFLVHCDQEDDARAIVRKYDLEGIEIVGVRDATDALERLWGEDALAVRLIGAGDDPKRRTRIIRYLSLEAMEGRGTTKTWEPLERAAATALGWANLSADERNELVLARMVAIRHMGQTDEFEVPESAWIERQPQARRDDIRAQLVAQCGAFGKPSRAELQQAIDDTVGRLERGESPPEKLAGAVGRLLATSGEPRRALELQQKVVRAFVDATRHAESTYALCEVFRLSGALGDRVAWQAADELWQHEIQHSQALNDGRFHVVLARARGQLEIGIDPLGARAALSSLVQQEAAPTHVCASAIRLLGRSEGGAAEDQLAELEQLEALPTAEGPIARVFRALMRLDEAIARGDDLGIAFGVLMERMETSLPAVAADLRRAATKEGADEASFVAKWFPY